MPCASAAGAGAGTGTGTGTGTGKGKRLLGKARGGNFPPPRWSVITTPVYRATLRLPLVLSVAAHLAIGGIAARVLRTPEAPAAEHADRGSAGETFEVPEEQPLETTPMPGSAGAANDLTATPGVRATAPHGGSAGGSGAPPEAGGTERPRSAHHARRAGGAPAPPPEAAPAAVYGAAGERGSADLATAFTRGFPQAASGDARWTHVPFGPAGTADVILDIDAAGTLVDHSILGSPSPALRAGIDRTLTLIAARAFTATAPRTHLRIVATVSPDEVHDGLHGDVFAIGGSFAQAEGSAFFALAVGRRIDVRVRVVR